MKKTEDDLIAKIRRMESALEEAKLLLENPDKACTCHIEEGACISCINLTATLNKISAVLDPEPATGVPVPARSDLFPPGSTVTPTKYRFRVDIPPSMAVCGVAPEGTDPNCENCLGTGDESLSIDDYKRCGCVVRGSQMLQSSGKPTMTDEDKQVCQDCDHPLHSAEGCTVFCPDNDEPSWAGECGCTKGSGVAGSPRPSGDGIISAPEPATFNRHNRDKGPIEAALQILGLANDRINNMAEMAADDAKAANQVEWNDMQRRLADANMKMDRYISALNEIGRIVVATFEDTANED